MACRGVRCSVFLQELWRPFRPNITSVSPLSLAYAPLPPKLILRVRVLHRAPLLKCSHGESPDTSCSSWQDDQGPPQEAVLKAISEVSKTEGRVAQTTNVVIGGTVTDDSTNEWLALDQKVNSYPTVRGFTAIGTGGDDFVQAMVVAVESVLQQRIPEVYLLSPLWAFVHRMYADISPGKICNGYLIFGLKGASAKRKWGHVTQKLSSRGKYVSVNIGPVRVVSSEQVQAVYSAMRRDDRMKYFL